VGAAVAFKRGSHIAVSFVVQRIPKRGQKILAVGVHLLGIVFFAIIAVYGVLLMKTEFQQTSPALQIPMVWVYAVFPVLGAAIILHLVVGIRTTLEKV
jgi:TRAP-type C4-dicarboxylate transport system permease small subunit